MRKYQCDVSADNVPSVRSPAVGAPYDVHGGGETGNLSRGWPGPSSSAAGGGKPGAARRDYQYHAFADHIRTPVPAPVVGAQACANINAMRSPAASAPSVRSPAVGAQAYANINAMRTPTTYAPRARSPVVGAQVCANINAMPSPTVSAPPGPTACCRSALQERLLMPSILHTGPGCE